MQPVSVQDLRASLAAAPTSLAKLGIARSIQDLREAAQQEPAPAGLTVEQAKAVAETIRAQLGGQKFTAMTGASNFVSHSDTPHGGLSFRLPSRFAKEGINYVKILVNDMDTYDMTFGKIRGMDYSVLKTVEGVYNDGLTDVFTDITGLDTSLGTSGPSGKRVTKKEAMEAYDDLSYSVDDLQGHMDVELLRVDVPVRLQPKIDVVNSLVTRGWPVGAITPDGLLSRAQAVLDRYAKLKGDGLSKDMGRGEAFVYLTGKGLNQDQANAILATPSYVNQVAVGGETVDHPGYTIEYLNEQAAKVQADQADTGTVNDDPVVTPEEDIDRSNDAAFLQSMIDGTANLLDEGLFDRLEPLFTKYGDDAAMMDLLEKAANAYSEAATAAAQGALKK